MAHSIQSVRNVYDIAKCARDCGNPFSNEEIIKLLERTVTDKELISKYSRFDKGYAAEDLFMRIFSLLPWVHNVIPLGQEQFPESSKEGTQIPDYEIIFEAGDKENTSSVLVEAKLVDGEKSTFEISKSKYNVLQDYSCKIGRPLLFAVFWRKQCIWTVNSIEVFSEKSSGYKISYSIACANDLSAIFCDYTYLFRKQCYRKSVFSKSEGSDTEYVYSHEKHGKTLMDAVSLDGRNYTQLNLLETPLLDCAFDFKEIEKIQLSDWQTEITEQSTHFPYIYKFLNCNCKLDTL